VSFDPAHRQGQHAVRFDWGPTGAAATVADRAIVVDVLSFTTTVSVATARGITVLPYPWRDGGAATYAQQHGAALAVGRLEARDSGLADAVSLSPARMLAATGVERVVLPSPNGSSIAFALAASGAEVYAASLRNAAAVARAVVAGGGTVSVIAAGERWPDDTLRPAVEDLWGAGAVLAALADLGVTDLSPEARAAEAAYRGAVDLAALLGDCAGGRELIAKGFGEDVDVAAGLDADAAVPVLVDGRFVAADRRRKR
jgi:2-phosphosulfolactate phosphatase